MSVKKGFDDLEILEDLKNRLYQAIINDEPIPKVGDLLKVIEMKNKLSVSGKAEKKFWEMIDRIRRKELANREKHKPTDEGKQKAKKKSPLKQLPLLVVTMTLFWLFGITVAGTLSTVMKLDSQPVSPHIKERYLQVLVGDSMAADFVPKFKISAWNGECSLELFLDSNFSSAELSAVKSQSGNQPRVDIQTSMGWHSLYVDSLGNLEWEIIMYL